MMALSRRDVRTFEAVAAALLGPSPPGVEELGIAERFPSLFERLPDPKLARDLRRFLRLLRNPVGCGVLFGNPIPFRGLPPLLAERALRRMATHRAGRVRMGYQAVRRLAGYLATTTEDGTPSPMWTEMGYPVPAPPPRMSPSLHPIEFTAASRWDTDVVVVGSGAGGGVAAAVLAQAGLDVVVLEKGKHLGEGDFTHHEGQAHRDLYLDGTLGSTDDLGIALLAGSCVGGGTTVNYCTSFATPPEVREEWDRVAGFHDVFTGDDFEIATKTVMDRIHVTVAESAPSRRDRIMQAGLEAIGLRAEVIPRNVEDCPQDEECGSCLMGCRRRAKNGAASTWLVDAAGAGARIVAGARVDRVLVEGGRAVGVQGWLAGNPLTVRARTVVLACGTLHTPGVLQRSGIGGKAVGTGLYLHPVTAVWGRFSEPVRPWEGVAQARYADSSADLDGAGYGYRFETAPIHPALPGALLPWDGAQAFRRRLAELPYLTPVGILLRDRDSGSARVRGDGRPYWRYRLSPRDQTHVRAGVHRAAEVLAAAGAEEVFASTTRPLSWNGDSGEPLPAFLERVDAAGYGPNRTTYVSFHQMGTAAMGADPRRSVVGADNQVHGVPGLYVMDASCFPTSSGVNPMVTIEAIAHRGASILAARLA